MKNFKKILALLLTVCILCAVTVVSVFAAPTLNVATDDGMIGNVTSATRDFDNGKYSYGNSSVFNKLAKATFPTHAGSTTDKYFRISHLESDGAVVNASGFMGWDLGVAYNPDTAKAGKYAFIHNDYYVFDFEICADKYIDNITHELTDSATDANGAANRVSYPEGLQIAQYYRVGSSVSIQKESNTMFLLVYDSTKGYCLRQSSGKQEALIDLPDVANEWTHITMVFEIDSTVNYVENGVTSSGKYDADRLAAADDYSYNLSKTKLHIYANGEYMGTDEDVLSSAIDASSFWKQDNVITNGGIENAGFYQIRMYPKNASYTEDEVVKYKQFSYGFDNFACNAYRTGYNGDLATFVSNIVADGKDNAHLSTCSDVVYNVNYDGPAAAMGSVYNTDGTELTLVKGYDVAAGAVINATEGQYVILEGNVNNVTPKASFYVYVPDGKALTLSEKSGYAVNDANTVTATLNGEEYTFKKVERPAYAITDTNGNITEYKFNPDELLGDFKAQKAVKLLSDFNSINVVGADGNLLPGISVNSAGDKYNVSFGSPEVGGKFSIDVNGHTLNLSNLTATPAISIHKNCKVDIFSSDVGGHIICTNDTFLRGNDFGGAKVTLGKVGDKCGENAKLTITANALFSTTQNARDLNDNEATFTVYGINYNGIGTKENHSAVYVAWNTRVNIYDSYFDIPNEGASLLACMNNPGTNKNHGVIDAYVENTTVVAAGNIIARLGDYSFGSITEAYKCEATFNNCVLSGNITPTDDALEEARRGTVYLEGGTKLLTSETITSDKVVASKGFVLAKATEETFNYVALANGSDKLSTLTFNGGEAEYWYAGSALPTGEDGEKFELYYEKFAGWTDGETVYTVAPAGTYALTSAQTVIVNIPNIKLNLTANNGFIVNYYVPASYGVTADAKSAGTIEKGGTVYDIYTVAGISPNNVEGATIVLTLNVDGVDYTQTITVSLLSYFNAVLKSDDAEAQILVVNAVNYCNEIYKVANKTEAGYDAYNAILAENTDKIISAEDAKAVDVDAQEQGVFGEVQFIISEGNVPMFAFTKLTDGKVSVKFTNIYGDPIEIICTEVKVDTDVYYAVAEMPVYEMIDSFEVYVNDAKVGNYSIANYVEMTENKIASALYGYGKAVANWKIED